jgi:mannose-6-phosphate isomerase-like protein (cupin superfamily)
MMGLAKRARADSTMDSPETRVTFHLKRGQSLASPLDVTHDVRGPRVTVPLRLAGVAQSVASFRARSQS